MCIFPEGKITSDGALNAFKPGVEKIVQRTPVPVIPIALVGLWGSFFSRKGGKAMRRPFRRFWSRIELVVGEPVPPGEVTRPTSRAASPRWAGSSRRRQGARVGVRARPPPTRDGGPTSPGAGS